MLNKINRIAVVGNGGGGKTTISRALAARYDLPLTHVDSIQFLSGMLVRNLSETSAILNNVVVANRWLIDGFGSLEVMTLRFERADLIVFIDFPLWRHCWWCFKRQIKSIRKCRAELPPGCNEATLGTTIRLFKILWKVHNKIKPQLTEIFERKLIQPKVLRITTLKQWDDVFRNGLDFASGFD